jgi:hypothetical protein
MAALTKGEGRQRLRLRLRLWREATDSSGGGGEKGDRESSGRS